MQRLGSRCGGGVNLKLLMLSNKFAYYVQYERCCRSDRGSGPIGEGKSPERCVGLVTFCPRWDREAMLVLFILMGSYVVP